MPRILKYQEAKLKIGRLMQELHLREGDKLPPESELANRLGMSIGPVRQALEDLRGVGVVRKAAGVGTFLAQKLSDEAPTATVGLVSVDDHSSSGGQRLFDFKQAAQKRNAAYQVVYADGELDPAVAEELSACDRMIVTGRIHPWWVDYLSSLGKPLVLLGETPDDRTYQVPRVRYDWEKAFHLGIRAMEERGCRNFAGVFFSSEHYTASERMKTTLSDVLRESGLSVDASRFHYMSPETEPVEAMMRFFQNNLSRVDAVLLDCSCVEIYWYVARRLPELNRLQTVVFGEEFSRPYCYADFDRHHQLYFPESCLEAAVKVLFDWSGKFVEENQTYFIQPELIANKSIS